MMRGNRKELSDRMRTLSVDAACFQPKPSTGITRVGPAGIQDRTNPPEGANASEYACGDVLVQPDSSTGCHDVIRVPVDPDFNRDRTLPDRGPGIWMGSIPMKSTKQDIYVALAKQLAIHPHEVDRVYLNNAGADMAWAKIVFLNADCVDAVCACRPPFRIHNHVVKVKPWTGKGPRAMSAGARSNQRDDCRIRSISAHSNKSVTLVPTVVGVPVKSPRLEVIPSVGSLDSFNMGMPELPPFNENGREVSPDPRKRTRRGSSLPTVDDLDMELQQILGGFGEPKRRSPTQQGSRDDPEIMTILRRFSREISEVSKVNSDLQIKELRARVARRDRTIQLMSLEIKRLHSIIEQERSGSLGSNGASSPTSPDQSRTPSL